MTLIYLAAARQKRKAKHIAWESAAVLALYLLGLFAMYEMG
jgi:4'-phosphopantetheinyl transferase EntD